MKQKRNLKTKNLILIFLLLAILLVLKFSTLRTPSFIPEIIVQLFEKPNGNTNSYEMFRLLENLSLAYIAAFIFYFLIEYRPKKIAAKKAFLILESRFVNIYLNMSRMISPLKMILNLEKDTNQILIEDVRIIKRYTSDFDKIYFRSTTFLSDKGESGHNRGIFLFHKDLPKYANSVTKEIRKITELPIISNVDLELIELVSAIESCEFIKRCKLLSKTPFQNVECEIHNFDVYFYDFIKLYLKLAKYKFQKISYNYQKLSKEEIKEMQKEQDKVYSLGMFDNAIFYHNSIEYRIENGKLVQ